MNTTLIYNACPKCGHQPPQKIGETEACPACGVYMHKWQSAQAEKRLKSTLRKSSSRRTLAANSSEVPDDNIFEDQFMDWRRRLTYLEDADSQTLIVRAMVLGFLAVWGVVLASQDIASGAINSSFMHSIVLPIHEAGHIFFIPFGEFLTIAGGSFFQVAFPLGIAIAFLVKNRDPFGAAVCLWWTGMSVIDLAPYVYDALEPQLMLLGGHTGEDGPHDWIYLFERLGGLRHAHFWGRCVHLLGLAIGTLALVWAGSVLWLARQRGLSKRHHLE